MHIENTYTLWQPSLRTLWRDAHIIYNHIENGSQHGPESEEGVPVTEAEPPLQQAGERVEKAEQDSDRFNARVQRATERMETGKSDLNSRESIDRLRERLKRLDERALKLREQAPQDFLDYTFVGEMIKNEHFGVTPDGRTYVFCKLDCHERLIEGKQPMEADAEGEIFHRTHDWYDVETRSDGMRIYIPVDNLEGLMEEEEQLFSTDRIKENAGFKEQFDREHRVQGFTTDLSEESIDLKNPPEKLADAARRAQQYNRQLNDILQRTTESALKTRFGRFFAGMEVVLGRDGTMLLTFKEDVGPEFRALAKGMINDMDGHIRNYKGRYVVDIVPESFPRLIACTKLLILEHEFDGKDGKETTEVHDVLKVLDGGFNLETPIEAAEALAQLHQRLEPMKRDLTPDQKASDPGKFLVGLTFHQHTDGKSLYFTHDSKEAATAFFKQVKGSEELASDSEIFKGIVLTLKDKTFSSNALSPYQAGEVVNRLELSLRTEPNSSVEKARELADRADATAG